MTPALTGILARRDVAALLSAFAAAGEEARIVGGAVRDAVLGLPISEIDVATTMPPEGTIALAQAQGWKAVPTGLAHGTVTVVIGGVPFEVTTLRRDVATDGRHAVVAFTRDFREDAARRDFTLNALSLSADGVVHDDAGGVADARAGRIRFVGDPATRIREDYLRILRFFRFHASHGVGEPDPAGLAACAALRDGLAGLSRERIRQELLKLVGARGAAGAAAAMHTHGLWPHVLPGIAVDTPAFARWTQLRSGFAGPPDVMAGLAVLAGPAATPEGLTALLKLSRKEEHALRAISVHAAEAVAAGTSAEALRRAVHRAGPQGYVPALQAGAARAGLEEAAVGAMLTAAAPVLAHPPRLPFTSRQAAALGVAAGPRMGRVLKRAESLWLEAGCPDDAETSGKLLAEAVAAAD